MRHAKRHVRQNRTHSRNALAQVNIECHILSNTNPILTSLCSSFTVHVQQLFPRSAKSKTTRSLTGFPSDHRPLQHRATHALLTHTGTWTEPKQKHVTAKVFLKKYRVHVDFIHSNKQPNNPKLYRDHTLWTGRNRTWDGYGSLPSASSSFASFWCSVDRAKYKSC